jgi:hypothetical protein
MHLPYMDLVSLIRGAGRIPVERDSLYQTVRESFDEPPPAGPDRYAGSERGRPAHVHAA